MSTEEAKRRAKAKYNAKMEIVSFRVPPEVKEQIKARAQANGESLAGYLQRLVREDAERSAAAQAEKDQE